jgi:hypothetical protein
MSLPTPAFCGACGASILRSQRLLVAALQGLQFQLWRIL